MTILKAEGQAPTGSAFIHNITTRQVNDSKSGKEKPRVKENTKEGVILAALARGESLNRFEAIRYHDTALNSTISTLQGKGLFIHRKWEKVPCVDGSKTVDVCRYSLTKDQIPIAHELLGWDCPEIRGVA